MNVLKIGDREITLTELIRQIKMNGSNAVLKPMLRQQAIYDCAGAYGLSVSDEALQNRFETIRKNRGLFTMADTQHWMRENSRTLEDLEQEAEIMELTWMLLRTINQTAVEKYFAEHKLEMDAAEISIITVTERGAANELAVLLKEGAEDFITMAREYSADSYTKAGGYMGVLKKADIPAAVSSAVFGMKPGEIAGPYEGGGSFVLVKLHNLFPAVLDGVMEQKIRQTLLERLLARNQKTLVWLV